LRIEARGIFLRPASRGDFREWHGLRLASADYLSRVELDSTMLSVFSFKMMLRNGEGAIAEGRGYPFLIFRRDGVLVGGLTLGPIYQRVARVGTWIGTPYVGKGYALRAVEAALGFAFGEAGIERVEAITLRDNLASIRVLLYHGFVDTGRGEAYMVAGVEREHLVYSRSKK
jgi:RimJ/RimL family protein N-acetyltransferase